MLVYVVTLVAVAFVMLRLLGSERQHSREAMYRKFVQDAPAIAREHREQIAREMIQR